MSTRGASAWVVKMPTGLPDCTSSVSSSPSERKAATMRSKASQSRAARPMPPYTTSSSGPLGDLGIEIVHEHAQRRLGQPALGRQPGAGGGLDAAAVVEARRRLAHGDLSASLSYNPPTVIAAKAAIPLANCVAERSGAPAFAGVARVIELMPHLPAVADDAVAGVEAERDRRDGPARRRSTGRRRPSSPGRSCRGPSARGRGRRCW